MSDKIPTAIWEGSFTIAGVKMRCYVLDNGQRIINADDVAAFFNGDALDTAQADRNDMDELAAWLRGGTPPESAP